MNPADPIRVVLWKEGEPLPPGLERRPAAAPKSRRAPVIPGLEVPGLETPAGIEFPPDQRVTVALSDIPVAEAAEDTGSLLNHSLLLAGNTAYFYPDTSLRLPLVERTFYPVFPSKVILDPGMKPHGTSELNLSEFLRSCGCSIPPDGYAIYHRNSVSIRVRMAEEDAGLAEAVLFPTDSINAQSPSERRELKFELWWWDTKHKIRSLFGLPDS